MKRRSGRASKYCVSTRSIVVMIARFSLSGVAWSAAMRAAAAARGLSPRSAGGRPWHRIEIAVHRLAAHPRRALRAEDIRLVEMERVDDVAAERHRIEQQEKLRSIGSTWFKLAF